MHSDLRMLDPIITTAYIQRDYGYMVYDTLLAMDPEFKIQPQMADWKVSDDKLTYTFMLRDGLKWHDGTPVTAEDCVASLKRWGKRRHGPEAHGLHRQPRGDRCQDHHAEAEGALRPGAGIDRQAVVAGAVHDAEAPCGNTEPARPIPEQIGSGPFKFVQAEFQPGVKAVL